MSDDEDEMAECQNCDLRFQVIFCNDALAQAGDRPNQYCPRCGEEMQNAAEQ